MPVILLCMFEESSVFQTDKRRRMFFFILKFESLIVVITVELRKTFTWSFSRCNGSFNDGWVKKYLVFQKNLHLKVNFIHFFFFFLFADFFFFQFFYYYICLSHRWKYRISYLFKVLSCMIQACSVTFYDFPSCNSIFCLKK